MFNNVNENILYYKFFVVSKFCSLDQMVAAYCTGFNLDGSQLVCGFRKCLRVFHINRPGRIFDQIDAKGDLCCSFAL